MTMMYALLFVLNVYMLREYDGARVTVMMAWGMEEVWLW